MRACWHYAPQLLLVFGRPPAGYPKPRYASFSSAMCTEAFTLRIVAQVVEQFGVQLCRSSLMDFQRLHNGVCTEIGEGG